MARPKLILYVGDTIAIALLTLTGFATHEELNMAFFSRMLAMFVPLMLAWFLLAPWFGLFEQEITSSPKQLWRPAFVMVLAAPLAAVLRSLLLNTAILPVFAVVLAATSAFGMLLWRGLYLFLNCKS